MEATNKFAVFESAAKQSRVVPLNARSEIWRAKPEAPDEPRSALGLIVAVGMSLSVWGVVAFALFT